MNLVKTGLLNGIAVAIRLGSAIVLNKVLAVYVGPTGYAVIGQFQNIISLITSIASGAVNTGVTKYTAEYFDNDERRTAIWKTAAFIAAVSSLLTAITIIFLSRYLAEWFLDDANLSVVFICLSIGIFPFVLNALLISILNGRKEIRRLVLANISGSLVGLVVIAGLASLWKLRGALIALALYQSFSVFATLFFCRGVTTFRLSSLLGKVDKPALRQLSKFALMTATSACVVPISMILIRNILTVEFGLISAGHWQAVWKISEMYLMLITTTLSVYFLPRISEIRSGTELKSEILNGYKILLPLVIAGAVLIYLLRDFITTLLFTRDFLPMRELFAWQLIGDVLKIGSWLVSYVMWGRALTRVFLITEVGFSAFFVLLAYIFTSLWGLKGASIAYATSYFFYWLVMYKYVFVKLD